MDITRKTLVVSLAAIAVICCSALAMNVLAGQYYAPPELRTAGSTSGGQDQNKIFLKSGTIDTDATPSLGTNQIDAMAGSIGQDKGYGYYIVQLQGPVTQSDRQSLEQGGGRIAGYLPENAFIVRITGASSLSSLQSQQRVKWLGVYKPDYKIEPSLSSLINSVSGATVTVTIQVFAGGDTGAAITAIENDGGIIITSSTGGTGNFIRAAVPGNEVASIAGLTDVEWIEQYREPHLMNDVATDIMGASSNYAATTVTGGGVWKDGFTGTGQAVAVADTGLDIGNSGGNFIYNSAAGDYEANNGVAAPFHQAFQGKVIHAYTLGRPGDFSDPGGHGTHVAGSVLGHDTQTSFAPGASPWGTAYGANDLVFMSIEDASGGLGGTPPDLNTLFGQEYTDTLAPRISTNSWGTSGTGGYNTESEQVDTFLWNHPDMLILFSAGNDGKDTKGTGIVALGSLDMPASAKDVVTVGASENLRPDLTGPFQTWGAAWPDDFPADPIKSDKTADNVNGMAAFSSRGPAADGRIKPDIAAPGSDIISARSHAWAFNDDFSAGTGKWSFGTPWTITTVQGASAMTATSDGGSIAGGWLSPTGFIDIRGGASILVFKADYTLTANDALVIWFWNDDAGQWISATDVLTNTSTAGSWVPVTISFQGLTPFTQMTANQKQHFNFRFEFVSNSTPSGQAYAAITDVRVCPQEWGLLSSFAPSLTAAPVPYGSPIDENYILSGGTSMATPLAAGAAADVRQWLVGKGFSDPSAALMKAVLINGATDMYPGQYGTGQYQEMPVAPNNVEGFGRVNLVNSLIASGKRKIYMIDNRAGNGLKTGGISFSNATVEDGSAPLTVTLVWTDYPSTPAASVNIVNVLHLSVTTPSGAVVYPNGLPTYDSTNNVQRVSIPVPATGTYGIMVAGHNVPQGVAGTGDQPYAVVVSGDVSGLTPPPTVSSSGGCSCSTADARQDPLSSIIGWLIPVMALLGAWMVAKERERSSKQ